LKNFTKIVLFKRNVTHYKKIKNKEGEKVMKKIGKILSAAIIAVLTVVMCFAFAACGGDSGDSKKTYSTTFDNIESWDYSFIHINSFGETAGVGMININSWGNKKLELGEGGTCDGVGCKWTLNLEVEDTAYSLYFIAHVKGAGTDYTGEGDFTYLFQGTCESVTGGYKLATPTYAKVTITGTLVNNDSSSFANYIPSAPWEVDSKTADDAEAVTKVKSKVTPSKLCSTVLNTATIVVSGNKITEVKDITLPNV
jgi:hypothetical protein